MLIQQGVRFVKLYNGMSPNGMRVEIFLQEKCIDLPRQPVDIMRGQTQSDAYRKINSLGEVPALELDDGRILTESVAICRYLEALNPEPALFGKGVEEQAMIEMWNKRLRAGERRLLHSLIHALHQYPDGIAETELMDMASIERALYNKRLGPTTKSTAFWVQGASPSYSWSAICG